MTAENPAAPTRHVAVAGITDDGMPYSSDHDPRTVTEHFAADPETMAHMDGCGHWWLLHYTDGPCLGTMDDGALCTCTAQSPWGVA